MLSAGTDTDQMQNLQTLQIMFFKILSRTFWADKLGRKQGNDEIDVKQLYMTTTCLTRPLILHWPEERAANIPGKAGGTKIRNQSETVYIPLLTPHILSVVATVMIKRSCANSTYTRPGTRTPSPRPVQNSCSTGNWGLKVLFLVSCELKRTLNFQESR